MTLDSDFRPGDWIVKPQLARLERQEGQDAEAMKHYRDFLELWFGADRDLPEIAEARAYLASAS